MRQQRIKAVLVMCCKFSGLWR